MPTQNREHTIGTTHPAAAFPHVPEWPLRRHRATLRRTCLAQAAAAALWLAAAGTSHATLAGFEQSQGYQPFFNPVQGYNAGQYGPGSGYPAGNVYAPLPLNTGAWQVDTTSGGGFGSYATGHQNMDRGFVNNSSGSAADQGLVITTSHLGWGGPALKYSYQLDTQDLGVNPATTGNSTVSLQFWWCAQLYGTDTPGGGLVSGYFGDEIRFLDSGGNVGFALGLTQDVTGDKVTYWDGVTMTQSAIVASSHAFDRWNIVLDLVNDTVSASYAQFLGGSLQSPTTLVTNQPMKATMANLTSLDFRTSPGVGNAKLLALDDFEFRVEQRVPEPGSLALVGPALLGLAWAGRRRAARR